MFTFKYPVTALKEFTSAIAEQMGTKLIDNTINVPPSIGSGYIQLLDMPNDLHAFIMNFQLHTDLYYEQSKSDKIVYSLRFEDSHVHDSFTTRIAGEAIKDERFAHSSVYLASSVFDLGYLVKKGTQMRCITIQLQQEWLAKYFRMEIIDAIIAEYLALKTASLTLEPMDVEYKKSMSEIIEIDKEHPTHIAAIQNRIMLMVERFFNDLYKKRSQLKYQVQASNEDIEKVRDIERIITRNLSYPVPPLSVLAQLALMSPTKLKQLFREMYGKPIYQYYQYYRMQKAKDLLLSKSFTISEVADRLGFSGAGSFSNAFRKAFKILPSEYLS